MTRLSLAVTVLCCFAALLGPSVVQAAEVTVELGNAKGVTSVGAFLRWDSDGNLRKPVNKDAKIEKPEFDASATDSGHGKWVIHDLKPGRYDLVILLDKTRIEGFSYPPLLEFDPFLAPNATSEEDVQEFITNDIHKSQHYENKVEPLYMGTDKEKKVTRVLVQLIRDMKTSYTVGAGTMRHEIWQYDWNYGGWQKNKRTKVLDRIIMQVSDLRTWHWLWEPKLGYIEVKSAPVVVQYEIPKEPDPTQLKGLYPY